MVAGKHGGRNISPTSVKQGEWLGVRQSFTYLKSTHPDVLPPMRLQVPNLPEQTNKTFLIQHTKVDET